MVQGQHHIALVHDVLLQVVVDDVRFDQALQRECISGLLVTDKTHTTESTTPKSPLQMAEGGRGGRHHKISVVV